jgi:hypothetical protein
MFLSTALFTSLTFRGELFARRRHPCMSPSVVFPHLAVPGWRLFLLKRTEADRRSHKATYIPSELTTHGPITFLDAMGVAIPNRNRTLLYW